MRELTYYYHDSLSIIKLGIELADKNNVAYEPGKSPTTKQYQIPKYLPTLLEKGSVLLVGSRQNLANVGLFIISDGDRDLLHRMIVGNMTDVDWTTLSSTVSKLKKAMSNLTVYGLDVRCLEESSAGLDECDFQWVCNEVSMKCSSLHQAIWDTDLRCFQETSQLIQFLPNCLGIPFYERRFFNPDSTSCFQELEDSFTKCPESEKRSA